MVFQVYEVGLGQGKVGGVGALFSKESCCKEEHSGSLCTRKESLLLPLRSEEASGHTQGPCEKNSSLLHARNQNRLVSQNEST